MGLELPGELTRLLTELGYCWPEADETAIGALGQLWMDFADVARETSQQADQAVRELSPAGVGADLETFLRLWKAEGSATQALEQGAAGALAVSGALFVCSSVILNLKVRLVVVLSTAVAEINHLIAIAPATFGISLLEVQAIKESTRLTIGVLIQQAIEALVD